MHLRGCSFIDAVQWLDGSALQVKSPLSKAEGKHAEAKGALFAPKVVKNSPSISLIPPTPPTSLTAPTSPSPRTSPYPAPHTPHPISFVPPALDVSTWSAVKEYLTLKRGLPEKLVNELNQQGIIYADRLQNAVFIRKNIDGEITGASLRGTYKDSHFKGLAKNSDRSRGWFSLSIGSGELERIVLVESAIDAISAAALSHKNRKTLFISTDGAGAVPVEWLQQHLAQGVSVLIGYDRDRAGEEMAWAMVHSLLGVTQRAVTKSISSKVVSPNPLAALKPLNEAVANRMVKDLAMAGVSTQFIGMEAAPLHTPSSTRNYRLAWGERANTGNYTARDVIMVSGSGPWRSVTTEQIEQTFNNHYVPLLEKAIAASSQFVVGNAKGTDRLVQKFLTERGFKLETTKDNYTIATPLAIRQQLPGVTRYTPTLGKDWNEQLLFIEQNNTPSDELNVSSWKTMAKALAKEDRYIRHIEEVTLPLTQGQPLSDRALNALRLDEKTYKEIQTQLWQWLGAANALGKSEAYLRRIAEVAMEFNSIKPKALKEQAKTAMQQDFAQYRELLSISLAPELLLEASNTAAKVRTFLFKHGTMHSDQSIIFTSNQWRMELNGEAKAIVNNEHREILRVEGEKVVVFNPLPEERELMRELCAQMELERQQENFQQSEQETDRRRGRGR